MHSFTRVYGFVVAGMHTNVVTNIRHNECFTFSGGVQTKDGHTWYELQDVHGHHVSSFAQEDLHKKALL